MNDDFDLVYKYAISDICSKMLTSCVKNIQISYVGTNIKSDIDVDLVFNYAFMKAAQHGDYDIIYTCLRYMNFDYINTCPFNMIYTWCCNLISYCHREHINSMIINTKNCISYSVFEHIYLRLDPKFILLHINKFHTDCYHIILEVAMFYQRYDVISQLFDHNNVSIMLKKYFWTVWRKNDNIENYDVLLTYLTDDEIKVMFTTLLKMALKDENKKCVLYCYHNLTSNIYEPIMHNYIFRNIVLNLSIKNFWFVVYILKLCPFKLNTHNIHIAIFKYMYLSLRENPVKTHAYLIDFIYKIITQYVFTENYFIEIENDDDWKGIKQQVLSLQSNKSELIYKHIVKSFIQIKMYLPYGSKFMLPQEIWLVILDMYNLLTVNDLSFNGLSVPQYQCMEYVTNCINNKTISIF